MAYTPHETLTVNGVVVSPATTAASCAGGGGQRVLVTVTADCRYTLDGSTSPVITGGSEVGSILRSTDPGLVMDYLTFLQSKWLNVSGAARLQAEFVPVTFYSVR